MDDKINIQLDIIDDRDNSEVHFRISFINSSDSEIGFYFSNASRKAERIGLNIFDSGNLVEPVEFEIIKLSGEDGGENKLKANGRLEYDLLASFVRPGVLKFPGASYLLKPDRIYDICFKYQGRSSNIVSWKPPVWW